MSQFEVYTETVRSRITYKRLLGIFISSAVAFGLVFALFQFSESLSDPGRLSLLGLFLVVAAVVLLSIYSLVLFVKYVFDFDCIETSIEGIRTMKHYASQDVEIKQFLEDIQKTANRIPVDYEFQQVRKAASEKNLESRYQAEARLAWEQKC